ncbi:hypothetical protein [Actinoplanes sp. NPDC049265]|uniref:hypothetical protein n=1 Tax=Actinoplanes sp. NPDC049265 TaxID=3363902 RepID=UPI003718B167
MASRKRRTRAGERTPRSTPPPAAPPTIPEPSGRYPEVPARLAIMVLATLLIVGGHLGYRYVADPGTIPGPWRIPAALLAAVVIFLSVSTLTQLTSILMFSVSSPSAKRFLSTIGSFSAVGAILGTTLGFRVGSHLFAEAGRDPSRYGFPELLGTVSDTVTLMTLVAVALCWPLVVPLLRDVTRERHGAEGPGRASPALNLLLIAGGNAIGVQAALFTFQLFTG